ncbi:hypothetical protein RDI58_028717 [Solanum bulbocastanum]|uniref:Uncharacterized protein n=1 Tax=Solanum bulbocastanum TaxID=147425 RepID=A0AAN8SSF6_SOLBU
MTRERESLEKNIKFQKLILKDEEKKVTRVESESSEKIEEIHFQHYWCKDWQPMMLFFYSSSIHFVIGQPEINMFTIFSTRWIKCWLLLLWLLLPRSLSLSFDLSSLSFNLNFYVFCVRLFLVNSL